MIEAKTANMIARLVDLSPEKLEGADLILAEKEIKDAYFAKEFSTEIKIKKLKNPQSLKSYLEQKGYKVILHGYKDHVWLHDTVSISWELTFWDKIKNFFGY